MAIYGYIGLPNVPIAIITLIVHYNCYSLYSCQSHWWHGLFQVIIDALEE
jgi:hypothetical protein